MQAFETLIMNETLIPFDETLLHTQPHRLEFETFIVWGTQGPFYSSFYRLEEHTYIYIYLG